MRLVFIDPATPKPYSGTTLLFGSLGGTEATIVRVAERLDGLVLQHNRTQVDGRYRPLDSGVDPTHVVTLRDPETLIEVAKRFPLARHYLWLHDLCDNASRRGQDLIKWSPDLSKISATLICVSDYHADQVRSTLGERPAAPLHVERIYNPVQVDLHGSCERDPNKIVFFSSPHKGLHHAIRVLQYLRRIEPQLTLYVANPGYNPGLTGNAEGIVDLGSLTHSEIMRHVRSATFTFYPNYVYPETFGLAMAESNALGTPVMTHAIGAAAEVLCGDGQIIGIPRLQIIAEKIGRRALKNRMSPRLFGKLGLFRCYSDLFTRWRRDGTPRVEGRPDFGIETVGSAWERLLA